MLIYAVYMPTFDLSTHPFLAPGAAALGVQVGSLGGPRPAA